MDALLAKDWTVEQVLETYPSTVSVFIRFRADCVGCRLERFCTLEEVARDYDFSLDDLLAALQEVVTGIQPKEK